MKKTVKGQEFYEVHELSRVLPDMSTEEYEGLKDDIRVNGLISPIVLHEGKILDGKNRYLACLELGITPETIEWGGKGSALGFVISKNLQRRHLTSSQKAAIASEILLRLEEEARRQQAHGKTGPHKTLREKVPPCA